MYGLYNMIYNKKYTPWEEWYARNCPAKEENEVKDEKTTDYHEETSGANASAVGIAGSVADTVGDRNGITDQRPAEFDQRGNQEDNDDLRNEEQTVQDDKNQHEIVPGAEKLHEV